MVTHNTILSNLRTIATAHAQINAFGCGDIWEIATSGTTDYALMWVVPVNSRVQKTSVFHDYEFYIMDRVSKDEGNEDEVLSDTKQICLDVIAQLDKSTLYDFKLETESIELVPFTDKFEDEVAGWQFTLSFKVGFDKNRCAIPFTGTLTNTSTGQITVLILDQNGLIVDRVAMGGSYSVIVASGIDSGSSTSSYSNQVVDI